MVKLLKVFRASASRLTLLEEASLVVVALDSNHKHSNSHQHSVVLVQAVASPSKLVSSEVVNNHLLLGVPNKLEAFLANRTQLHRLPDSVSEEVSRLLRRARASLEELQVALVDLDSCKLSQVICSAARASRPLLSERQASRTLHHLGLSSNNSQLRVLLVKLVLVCLRKAKHQHNLDLQPPLLELQDFLVNNSNNSLQQWEISDSQTRSV